MSARLPPAARTLIRRHVHSVGELELLVLLHAERDRSWSARELCDVLGCPPTWAADRLEAMAHAGLVTEDAGGWRFAAASAELAQATEALCEAYRRSARDVVHFVFADASARSSVE